MRFTAVVAAAALFTIQPAFAQVQIKPRVVLMLDTSGSMVSHLTDDIPTFGDGSTLYKDSGITNNTYYRGVQVGSVNCNMSGCFLTGTCSGTFDGKNSRLFAAKQAINNVLNGSGDIDWGLMRYTGTNCAASATPFTPRGGSACATDFDCNNGEVCNGATGKCGTDSNFCNFLDGMGNHTNNYLELNNTCGAVHNLGLTYAGSCGTTGTAGAGACATAQVCYSDADCNGGAVGSCVALAGSAAKACQCAGAFTCPAAYACTASVCTYNTVCQSIGGTLLVDPSTANSSNLVFPFIDNVEDYTPSGITVVNPELRADGNTPLAGAARTATTWYNATIGGDAKKLCRPYILVQITDGFDTCDSDVNNGPIAAAQGFVAATTPGAKTLNKVYVVGLAFGGTSSPTLDAIAKAGGTNSARLANSAADIEAALADIVASSVLVEKCNHIDDNCNGQCDEAFPDVAVTNPAPDGSSCSNAHVATTCDNGARPGTHCFATGNFVCSADTLSEVCSAPKCPFVCPGNPGCAGNPLCAVVETCNGIDDDCNGVIDDCTAGSPNTCSCASNCPPCAAGGPFPETCNGCDDDCDGIADNHLNDTGIACGSNVGICMPGTTYCCQQANPTTGTCTTDPVTTRPAPPHANPDQLFCLGGTNAQMPQCNGCDNDCDGNKDSVPAACYSGPAGTSGKGICHDGAKQCTAVAMCPMGATYGPCLGDQTPQPEICNGLDDDCNGSTDDMPTDVGGDCCPTSNLHDCLNVDECINDTDCKGGAAGSCDLVTKTCKCASNAACATNSCNMGSMHCNHGAHCARGKIACVAGAKVCQNGVAKAPETCNNIDDDCNNATDDVPGIGAACTGGGILTAGPCKAKYVCNGTMPGTGPNGLTCTQTVGPSPEVCNGIDDDCDGTIDEPAEVMMFDGRVGVSGGTPCVPLTPLPGTMFPAGNPQPPCNPGTTACVAGMVVCQGEVQPMPNVCGGISTDCTGNTNTVTCPTGFQCVMGNCVQPCGGGEFPCPGGFVCETSTNTCIPDKCQMLSCPKGFLCHIDAVGNASCVDPCTQVTCGSDYQCVMGACVDCHTFGCPTGQLCIGTPGKCQPDPCANVMCPQGQYCDATGTCVMMCTGQCPPHELCLSGTCQPDPCDGFQCNQGEVCTVQGSPPTPVCVTNLCEAGCADGLTCCGGTCRMNQCDTLQCPMGATCSLDSACQPSCIESPTGPPDKVVGAGGGGTACSTVPGESARGSGAGLLLLVGVALFLARRRRAEVQ